MPVSGPDSVEQIEIGLCADLTWEAIVLSPGSNYLCTLNAATLPELLSDLAAWVADNAS